MAVCKSCGAPLVWIKTVAGKTMPCDAEMVTYTEAESGGISIVTPDGSVVKGNIGEGNKKGYISHFATCPNAAQHRRGGR
jgi:hypothetical protein